ncbi:MAG: SDR family oxidoreductase [Cognatishimia sp.]|uniref:SDR family NAD(P)-dependent oxidoreductase n=1 Tax=Cognatishimia sp. TaxID=2211648 RepID=UPI003B8B8124
MNQFDLKGRRAVITGGARGMGFAVAKRFLESGASVALWDISEETLAKAKDTLSSLGTVITQRVDVSDYANVEAAAAQAEVELGGIELLVNSAGIAGVNVPVTEYPIETWYAVQKVNLNGIFHTCKAIVPIMQKSDYGRIANIASIAGKEGNPNASAYSVSKAAVIGLTKSLGKELATSNIRVNALCPAVIRTEMLDDVTEGQLAYMLSKIPMGRPGTIDEIASMVSFMCSEDCSYTTGFVFDLSGGRATY